MVYFILKEIPLSEILSVEQTKQQTKQQTSSESGQTFCFELKTANVDYYIGEDPDMSRGWEVAIRQALMPVTAPKKITLNKDAGGIYISRCFICSFEIAELYLAFYLVSY